jgi:hypothetical protein
MSRHAEMSIYKMGVAFCYNLQDLHIRKENIELSGPFAEIPVTCECDMYVISHWNGNIRIKHGFDARLIFHLFL